MLKLFNPIAGLANHLLEVAGSALGSGFINTRMRTMPFFLAIPILLTALSLEAQFPDRLYPFIELTDEMLAQIDLKDGSIDDWLEVLGEPTLTPLDFTTDPRFSGYDPSSYDFRIWLAWHDATQHLFVAAEFVDDVHVITYDRYNTFFEVGDGTVWFTVDGDRSGGGLFDENRQKEVPEDMVQAQLYTAYASTNSNDSNVNLMSVSYYAPWVHREPYADGGGGLVDSQPIFSVVECYVTPFDRLIWNDPELSVVSDLFPDKIIDFTLLLADVDTEEGDTFEVADSIHHLFGPNASYDDPNAPESDFWAQGILLGADGGSDGTAVESVSWGRIKASLKE